MDIPLISIRLVFFCPPFLPLFDCHFVSFSSFFFSVPSHARVAASVFQLLPPPLSPVCALNLLFPPLSSSLGFTFFCLTDSVPAAIPFGPSRFLLLSLCFIHIGLFVCMSGKISRESIVRVFNASCSDLELEVSALNLDLRVSKKVVYSGSGVVIDHSHALTACHVVEKHELTTLVQIGSRLLSPVRIVHYSALDLSLLEFSVTDLVPIPCNFASASSLWCQELWLVRFSSFTRGMHACVVERLHFLFFGFASLLNQISCPPPPHLPIYKLALATAPSHPSAFQPILLILYSPIP